MGSIFKRQFALPEGCPRAEAPTTKKKNKKNVLVVVVVVVVCHHCRRRHCRRYSLRRRYFDDGILQGSVGPVLGDLTLVLGLFGLVFGRLGPHWKEAKNIISLCRVYSSIACDSIARHSADQRIIA